MATKTQPKQERLTRLTIKIDFDLETQTVSAVAVPVTKRIGAEDLGPQGYAKQRVQVKKGEFSDLEKRGRKAIADFLEEKGVELV